MEKTDPIILKNKDYDIRIHTGNGGILSFVNPQDKFGMNWVEGRNTWGTLLVFQHSMRNLMQN